MPRRLALVALLTAACGDSETMTLPPGMTPPGTPAAVELTATELSVTDQLLGQDPSRGAFLIVGVQLTLPTEAERSVPVTIAQFTLGLADNTSLVPTPLTVPDACPADVLLDPGGTITCAVGFDVAPDAGLVEVRFVDPTTGQTVSASTPEDKVPPVPVSSTLIIRDAFAAQLAILCAEESPLMAGAETICQGVEGLMAVAKVDADPAAVCQMRRLPVSINNGFDCIRLEVGDCTVADYRSCRDAFASDLCQPPIGPCQCLNPIFDRGPCN